MKSEFALVTGASSGIGLEIAKELSLRGYNLLLVSNDKEGLNNSAAEIRSISKVEVVELTVDLASTDSAEQVYTYCKEHKFTIEVLVNNAGFFFFGEAVKADRLIAKKMIQLHVLTTSLLCTLFGAEMKQRGKGYILNLSSISAFKDFPGIAYYGSTKSYIKSFTRSLRTELKKDGVNVTCLLPGATATNLYDPSDVDVPKAKRYGIMLEPDFVARKGIMALFNNRARSIPGISTKIMTFFAWLTPHSLIYYIRKRSKFLD